MYIWINNYKLTIILCFQVGEMGAGGGGGASVGVVVKVASQSVPDMTLDCQQYWTVRDLKNHLLEQHTLHPVSDYAL